MAPPDPLREYREKRTAERTPEPFGGEAGVVVSGAGLYVVQKHAARRTHYDLRLEMAGTLRSWAVPKGISTDPAEKRLAVQVEDHPLEYAEFEGIIPEGEYGAGAVIVWDQGRWVPLKDPEAGLAEGKLLFELRGHKLRGVWTLVRLKKSDSDRDWLLIRERRGGGVEGGSETVPEASVFSGLTVEELGARARGFDPGAPIREELEKREEEKRGPRRGTLEAEDAKLMLAESRERAFSRAGWLFELKLDGFRMLGRGGKSDPLLLTRNGKDATASFPEVARALGHLPFERVLLDGELVVNDEAGRPSFERLQRRARRRRVADIRLGSLETPATFYAFDLLGFEAFDLRPLPLLERKRILRRLLPPAGPIRYLEHFEEAGETLYEQVLRMGLEGIVAKRADSAYGGGRSSAWLKIRADRTGEFAVVGFTRPKGSRAGFGALHLAVRAGGSSAGEPPPSGTGAGASPSADPARAASSADAAHFRYAGKVGSGFSADQLSEIRTRLEGDRRPVPPCEGPVPRGEEHVWVEPELVVEVRYKEWTEESFLRQPVFLRLREDKRPEECRPPSTHEKATEPADAEIPDAAELGSGPAPEEVPLSNVEKLFWPEDGYTKGDLISYYRAIAPWLLPYLRDRPLVLTRYPDGIHGKSFFQKDAPAFVPEWIRTERISSEGAEREIAYFVVENEASLLYLANLGTIPLHMWPSRAGSLERPDWCVLDLDPKEAPFAHVITIARRIRTLCEEIRLPSYVKTTGSTGLHILIPLAARIGYAESRGLGELLARLVVDELPEIATTIRAPAKRGGRVYVDYLQNRRGQTVVAPYSVRPLPGAPVSAPLRWREVRSGLQIGRFTIRRLPRRARSMKEDPLRPVLEEEPDLLGALERLHQRLSDR